MRDPILEAETRDAGQLRLPWFAWALQGHRTDEVRGHEY